MNIKNTNKNYKNIKEGIEIEATRTLANHFGTNEVCKYMGPKISGVDIDTEIKINDQSIYVQVTRMEHGANRAARYNSKFKNKNFVISLDHSKIKLAVSESIIRKTAKYDIEKQQSIILLIVDELSLFNPKNILQDLSIPKNNFVGIYVVSYPFIGEENGREQFCFPLKVYQVSNSICTI